MKTAPLGEVAQVISGATPKTGVADYWEGDVPWATPADLSKLDGAYISETPRTITEAGVRSCATTVLPTGSVLLSSRAPIGHVAINTIPMATNQGFKSLVPGPTLDAKFLYHWLKSRTSYLQSLGNGATFKELSKYTTEQIEIPLPPLDEQRRIAEILDHADGLRTKRRQALAHIDTLTQSIFHDMFGDELTPIPLGTALSTAPIFTDGDWVESKDQDPAGDVRLTQLADIGDGRWLDRSSRFLNWEKAAQLRCTFLEAGDVLIARMPDPLGRACLFPGSRQKCVTVVDVCVVRPDRARHDPAWLCAAINDRRTRAQIVRLATGTTRSRVSRRNLAAVTIPDVPLERQQTFARQFRLVTKLRGKHRQAIQAETALFVSLQSRVFRGEL